LRSGIDFAMAGKLDAADNSLMGEELYRGEEKIEKVPILGPVLAKMLIKPSERTYTAVLDTQRMVMFNLFAGELQTAGLTMEKNPREFKKIAEFINVATGRGTMPQHKYGRLLLNLPLFAPRYTLSRLQLLNMTLNPVAYANMPPVTRKIIAKQSLRFYGTVGAIFALAAALGATVGLDPDDDEFLKIKIGNARYDLLAGELQPLKAIIKIVHSAIRTELGFANRVSGEFGKDVYNIVGRFLRGKLSPLASLGVDAALGEDYIGNEFSWLGNAEANYLDGGLVKRLLPLSASDMVESYKLDGLVGVAKSTPAAFFGIGVGTYKERPERPETEAEKLAAKIMASMMPDMKAQTLEEKKKTELRKDLLARSRKGEDVREPVAQAIKDGMLTKKQGKNVMNAVDETLLEEKVTRLGLDGIEQVFKVATEKEKAIIKPMLDEKMKNADVDGKLEPAQRKRLEALGGQVIGDVPMPDTVRAEFTRHDIRTPDVGETLTPEKGKPKVKLNPEQYADYRSKTLAAVYQQIEQYVNTPEYQQLDPEMQKINLDRMIRKSRTGAQQQMKRSLVATPQ
jgi:hypothetical protein